VLFSQRILAYDPYRQKWEKRLARLLSWRWASGVTADFSVEALIERLRVPIDAKNPIRTKERLEQALDTLRHDQLIGRWEQPGVDTGIVGKRGWLGLWMRWPLHIEAPPALAAGIRPDAAPAPKASATRERSFGFIRHIRAERDLSQAEVAAAIGLTQAQLSRIEAGGKVQAATAAKIKAWILDQL
jgi:DNA-binding XRE family transcriptional regulator